MNTPRSMLLLAAAWFATAVACSSDPAVVATTGPSLTTVPPIGTLSPPTTPADPSPTTLPPASTRPPVTAAPIEDPKPGVERFVPTLPLEDGVVSLDVVFVDGSRAAVGWPVDIDFVSRGLIPYGWAYIQGGTSRDFFIRPGTVAQTLRLLGGAERIATYPDADGSPIGLWRPRADAYDYLAFEFDGWTVLVFDYRDPDLQMSSEDRELWAAGLHGQATEDGFLVLSADHPLQLVFAGGDYPRTVSMTMRGEDGEVQLTPRECEPGTIDDVGPDAFAASCIDAGNLIVRAYGSTEFQQAVIDDLVVRSVTLAKPPKAGGG